MRKLIIPLVALAILYSCEKSSEVDVIAEEGLIGVSIRLDKGFAVSSSDSNVDSSWPHIFQDLVDITFSSTTSSYSKTVSFNPNDVSSFPNTSLPYDTYNWSIANTGGSVVVSSALYIYGSSSSAFTVSSASTTIPLTLSTDFALVTVSETNLSSVSISQGGTDTSLTTNNGFYYGYINSVFSDYTVTFTSVENQSASDTITTPSASTHYNYTISYEGGTSVTVALSDTFQLEERDVTIGSSVNLTNGLLAWYPFNGNANDESGNGNDGGLVNNPNTANDRFNNSNTSFEFNGVDQYIEISKGNISSEINSLSDAITISAWYKIDQSGIPNNIEGTIIARRDFTSNPNGERHHFNLGVRPNDDYVFSTTRGFNDEFYIEHYGNMTNLSIVSVWHHIAITFDSQTGELRSYIDGNLGETNSYNKKLAIYDHWINIGATRRNNGNPIFSFFHGNIDDIGIWNRALTDAEIQALYNETDSDLTN